MSYRFIRYKAARSSFCDRRVVRRFAVWQRAAFVGLARRVLLRRAFRAGEHAVVVNGGQVFTEPAVVHELGLDRR